MTERMRVGMVASWERRRGASGQGSTEAGRVSELERVTLSFAADSAQEATDQAKQWVRNRPGLRLRTIASCRLRSAFMWDVVVVVSRREVPA